MSIKSRHQLDNTRKKLQILEERMQIRRIERTRQYAGPGADNQVSQETHQSDEGRDRALRVSGIGPIGCAVMTDRNQIPSIHSSLAGTLEELHAASHRYVARKRSSCSSSNEHPEPRPVRHACSIEGKIERLRQQVALVVMRARGCRPGMFRSRCSSRHRPGATSRPSRCPARDCCPRDRECPRPRPPARSRSTRRFRRSCPDRC